jgi:hypothetical protein
MSSFFPQGLHHALFLALWWLIFCITWLSHWCPVVWLNTSQYIALKYSLDASFPSVDSGSSRWPLTTSGPRPGSRDWARRSSAQTVAQKPWLSLQCSLRESDSNIHSALNSQPLVGPSVVRLISLTIMWVHSFNISQSVCGVGWARVLVQPLWITQSNIAMKMYNKG